jgi:hypothetical protein
MEDSVAKPLKSASLRGYLNEQVVPVLVEALTQLAIEQ